MYLTKTPRFIQSLFPNYIWRLPVENKTIYLTFDDGPIPEVTPWVLDVLKEYDAKATFFCVGENIEKHPEVFQMVKNEGHTLGSHTYNHLSGWSTDSIPYFHNVRKCARLVDSDLFRPPYGRIKPKQIQFLSRHYQIVMWDVLSGDFDENITAEECFQNVVSSTVPGSIVVFHDSLKSEEKLRKVLPKTLAYFHERGYRFEAIGKERKVEETIVKRKREKVPA